MADAAEFYVLGIDNMPAWVLSFEPRTRAECSRGINWQLQAGYLTNAWAVCTYDRERGTFVDDEGTTYETHRGPYTVEAWERFLAGLDVARYGPIAPGQFSKAIMTGYTVEKLANGGENDGRYAAWAPEGISADVLLAVRDTERAAWEACDNHRLHGDVNGVATEGFMEREGEAFEALHDARFDDPSPQADAKPETRAVVVLSTAHLAATTCEMLENTPLSLWPVAGGNIAHGFYIYAHEAGEEIIPPDLMACCTWARRNDFDYIQFDCDGPIMAGLMVYDHEPREPVDALAGFAKVRDLFEQTPGWLAHHDDWSPADMLEAIAEAVGAPLNGKPGAPVLPPPVENCTRYMDALNDLGIPPNGDDCNALYDLILGGKYSEPTEGGR